MRWQLGYRSMWASLCWSAWVSGWACASARPCASAWPYGCSSWLTHTHQYPVPVLVAAGCLHNLKYIQRSRSQHLSMAKKRANGNLQRLNLQIPAQRLTRLCCQHRCTSPIRLFPNPPSSCYSRSGMIQPQYIHRSSRNCRLRCSSSWHPRSNLSHTGLLRK